jgi:hypothetical protein
VGSRLSFHEIFEYRGLGLRLTLIHHCPWFLKGLIDERATSSESEWAIN